MRASILIPVFAAAVFAQESSSTDDAHPQTSFLTQTNSLGVVTGMPSVATSQPPAELAETSIPALATSVGDAASIPAIGTGLVTLVQQGTAGVNSTQTIVVSANNSTTMVLTTIGVGQSSATGTEATPTGTGANPSQSGGNDDGEESGSATGSDGPASTGAAATMRAVAGSGIVGMGAFIAALL
jgi:hypothetical protein